jgi:hypothetical protein
MRPDRGKSRAGGNGVGKERCGLRNAEELVAEYFRDSKVDVVRHWQLPRFTDLELSQIDRQASNGCK